MTKPDEQTVRVQQLFVRHQGQLKAFALALWPDFARVDDVLQEVFLVVTAKASEFDPSTSFLAWSRAITRLKLLEARRRSNIRSLNFDALTSLAAACPEDWGSDQRLAALAKCLTTLAPKAQELIRLRYQREHSPKEIAEILTWTLGSVAVGLAKARVALRECIEHRLSQAGSQ